jgi:N-methylhydantoinase B
VINKGDTVSLGTPGGGGHGDPKKRDAAAFAADVVAGYVTERATYR